MYENYTVSPVIHRLPRGYRTLNNVAMIEIGVQDKCSINLWLNYFPNSFIYGIDINIDNEGERYKIFKGDQSINEDIINISNKITTPIFFILDDGSHIPEHQILTSWSPTDLPGGHINKNI
jgi:hypothetical protein